MEGCHSFWVSWNQYPVMCALSAQSLGRGITAGLYAPNRGAEFRARWKSPPLSGRKPNLSRNLFTNGRYHCQITCNIAKPEKRLSIPPRSFGAAIPARGSLALEVPELAQRKLMEYRVSQQWSCQALRTQPKR